MSFGEMIDEEMDGISIDSVTAAQLMTPTSPPAYTSEDECMKTPSPPRTPKLVKAEPMKLAPPPPKKVEKRRSSSDDSDEDDDDDYTEDEIAVLTFIDAFKPQDIKVTPFLYPFTIDYIPAMGDVDLFVKVPRPDEVDDNVGLIELDEPPVEQTDAAIVEMQIQQASKETGVAEEEVVVPVKVVEKEQDKEQEIKKWIGSMKKLHQNKPATVVKYNIQMPSIDALMQEHPERMEKLLNEIPLPTADLDCTLEEYCDICLNLLDIPVGPGGRIQALHVMFSMLLSYNGNQHYKNLQHNKKKNREESIAEKIDRLEL